MRSRKSRPRFRRRRGAVHWTRTSFEAGAFQTPIEVAPAFGTTMVTLFDPTLVTFVGEDAETTLRRVVINRPPSLSVDNEVIFLANPVVFYLTWYIFIQDRTDTNVPTNSTDLFAIGRDIIQGGVEFAQGFDASNTTIGSQSPVWFPHNTERNGNWIDTRLNRKVQKNEFIRLWTKGTVHPMCNGAQPFTIGEGNNPPCWVHDFDISMLWSRRRP